jgi:hypothetical protein
VIRITVHNIPGHEGFDAEFLPPVGLLLPHADSHYRVTQVLYHPRRFEHNAPISGEAEVWVEPVGETGLPRAVAGSAQS